MRKSLLLCCLFSLLLSYGQVPKSMDSLVTFIKTKPKDTLYVLALNEYAFQIVQQGKYDDAQKIILQMEALSKKFNYGNGFYKTMNMRGIVEYSKQKPDKAMAYFLKCNAIIQKYKLPKKIYQNWLNNIGVVYDQMGDRENATAYAMKLIDFQEKNKLEPLKTFPYDQIASNLKLYKKYDEALHYYRKSLAIETRYKNYTGMAIAENKIGNLYDDLNDDAAAISHYKAGLKYAQQIQYKLLEADLLTNLGRMYVHQKAYAKAREYLLQSERICVELGSPTSLTTIYNTLGNIYFFEGKYGPAEEYYLKELKAATAIDQPEELYIANQALAELKEQTRDYKAAYYYKVKAETQKDSTFKIETAQNTEDLLRKYEAEKKQQKINMLSAENKIKNLEIESTNRQQIFLIIGLVLLLLIAASLVVIYRNKQKSNRALSQKNQEMQELNKNLEIANATKAKLFSIISHDLRSPMSQISQFMDLQQSEPELFSEEDKIRHNERISLAAGAVLETMEDLLIWSKSQMQQFTVSPERFFIADIINSTAGLLHSQLEKKKLRLATPIDSGLAVVTDKNILTIILRNLLQNAVTFSPENSPVTISATIQDTHILISITNEGAGIPEPIRLAFNDGAAAISSSHSGLGLTLVREMAALIQARVEIPAPAVSGAIFTVSLPLG